MTEGLNSPSIEQQVPPESKILNEVAAAIPVEHILDPEVQELVDKLFSVARGRQGDANRKILVGLAAPQIGESQRAVIIGINAVGGGEQPELKEFINPEIISISDEREYGREGCFLTCNVCGIVSRATKVTVREHLTVMDINSKQHSKVSQLGLLNMS